MPRQAVEENKVQVKRRPRYRSLLLLMFAVLSIILVGCDRGKEAEELDLQEARRLRGTQESNLTSSNKDEERATLTLNPERAIQPSQRRMIFRSIPQEYRTTTTIAPQPTQTSSEQQTTPSSVTPETTTTTTTTTIPSTTPSTTPETTTSQTTTVPTTTETTTTETTTTEAQTLTVTFYTNGGTPEVAPQEIQPGSLVSQPAQPVFEGNVFLGWYYVNEAGSSQLFDFANTTVWVDLDIYAVWEPVIEESTTTEPTTVETTTEATTTEATTPVESSTDATTTEPTVAATIAMTLDYQDNINVETIELTPGTTYALPRPELEGYTFLQWTYGDLTPVNNPDAFLVPESDFTLYAQWEQAAPTLVTLTLNYNDDLNILTVEQAPGTPYGLPRPEREGFTFVQWTYADQSPVYEPDAFIIPESDTTLYAQWEVAAPTVVTLTLNYNDDINIITSEHTPGTTYSLPVPERDGFKFIQWVYEDQSAVATPEAFLIPESNVTLYAQWEAQPTTIQLTLDYQDGATVETSEHTIGSTFTLPTPERDGYKFVGWVNADQSPVPNPEAFIIPETDTTLYAQWEDIVVVTLDHQYMVPINEDEEEPKMSVIEGKPGEIKPLPKAEAMTRPGYKFKEWTSDREGQKPVPNPDSFAIPESDVTLYAQWEVDPPETAPSVDVPPVEEPPVE